VTVQQFWKATFLIEVSDQTPAFSRSSKKWRFDGFVRNKVDSLPGGTRSIFLSSFQTVGWAFSTESTAVSRVLEIVDSASSACPVEG
jgi:hypothetical protein